MEIGQKKINSRTVLKEVASWVLYFAIIIVAAILLNIFVVQRAYVEGASMEPTLSDSDNLIVDKISYRFREPHRFDIVVFPSEDIEGRHYVKRIIALPGETIQVVAGKVYIDGVLMEVDYGNALMQYAGIADHPLTLGDDEFFVLGDNRNNSRDSRQMGIQHRDDIIGRAFLRVWPLAHFGLLQHD